MDMKMDVLEALKCGLCEGYLSCSPVYILADGNNVCGRCLAPANQAPRRNMTYEKVAQYMKFPCRYKSAGCSRTAVFGLLKIHEKGCKLRQSICPVSTPNKCDWTGSMADILGHCKLHHPDTILQNPITLEHDSTTTNGRTFLISAFQMLFIVNAKVCLTTGKISHSVNLLYHTDDESEFNFELAVSNKNNQVIQSGKISTLNASEEDNSVVLSLAVILELFGGCDGTSFEITVKRQVCKLKVVPLPDLSFSIRGGKDKMRYDNLFPAPFRGGHTPRTPYRNKHW